MEFGGKIEEGRLDLLTQALEFVHQPFAQLVVEADQRIVENENLRVLQETARQRCALLLASG